MGAMWKDSSGLTEAELAELGFCKIAGSDLIYRHSSQRTRFRDSHPTGQEADVEAEPEFEEWVEQEWQRFSGRVE
ncbi:MAG: hypothetical protein JNM56_17105 [Planctomycetia bacterium]|nr:hypothetical protein [Planctomycetia bacterium]